VDSSDAEAAIGIKAVVEDTMIISAIGGMYLLALKPRLEPRSQKAWLIVEARSTLSTNPLARISRVRRVRRSSVHLPVYDRS